MRITHPHPALGRQKFIGIEFRDGAATVESLHSEVEASLLQHGFTIEQETLPEPAKVSKPRGRKADLVVEDEAPEGEFAIFELPDGTAVGDGESIATLQPDED